MLALIEFDFHFNPTKAQYEALRQCMPQLPEAKEDVAGGWSVPYEVRGSRDFLVDLELAAGVLGDIGAGIKFKPFKNNILIDLNDRFKQLERKMMLTEAKINMNGQIMQVHVPNNKLIEFNEVEVLEDECTHSLQTFLNEGWRIVAVCPPLEARRPTYIIGRHNPEHKL